MADTFTIVGQEEYTDYSTPTPTPSWRITYATVPSGVTGTVLVPKAQYTPDYVRRVVEDAAAAVEAVHQL